MPPPPLVAPTVLPSGTLHFAAVKQDALVKDVIQVLLDTPDVKEEVLGDLIGENKSAWALQRVTKNEQGRIWDDSELANLGNGSSTFLIILRPKQCSLTSRF